jgi:hypothetical protein
VPKPLTYGLDIGRIMFKHQRQMPEEMGILPRPVSRLMQRLIMTARIFGRQRSPLCEMVFAAFAAYTRDRQCIHNLAS